MGILAKRNDGRVVDDAKSRSWHITQIVTKEERRFERGPERKVRFVFFVGHTALTDFKHIQIAPTPRNATVGKRGDFVENEKYRAMCTWCYAVDIAWCQTVASTEVIRTCERVVDITRDAPAVRYTHSPLQEVSFCISR
jgi:hypothetical protein